MHLVVDQQLAQLLTGLPAVVIDGPRAVGKTATASRRVTTVIALDEPAERVLIEADRDRLARLPGPLLIDEWQQYPAVWDQVRRAVDAGAATGSYLLTGSATPATSPTHTGAGRIVRPQMRPMTLTERGLVEPTVSLADLLAGTRPPVSGGRPVGLAQYAEEIVAPNPDGPPVPRDGTLLGALFESLVTLCVRTCACASDAQVSHLRTHRTSRIPPHRRDRRHPHDAPGSVTIPGSACGRRQRGNLALRSPPARWGRGSSVS